MVSMGIIRTCLLNGFVSCFFQLDQVKTRKAQNHFKALLIVRTTGMKVGSLYPKMMVHFYCTVLWCTCCMNRLTVQHQLGSAVMNA